MIKRKIQIYSFLLKNEEIVSEKNILAKNFVITLPTINALKRSEGVIFEAEGALTIRLIQRTHDKNSNDTEMVDLRREGCFIFNELNEWIIETVFITQTEEGLKETCFLRLPFSAVKQKDKNITLWFNGVALRYLVDGEVINENYGVGNLCAPVCVKNAYGIKISEVLEVKTHYESREEDDGCGLYFPYGFNAFVGDVMSFYHDGTYHIVYLLDRRHHGSRRGRGAHSLAHLITKDLVNWEELEPIAEIEKPYETFGTGTMFYHDGKYYMSYGIHSYRHGSGKFIECDQTADGRFLHKTFQAVKSEGGIPLGATLSTSVDGVHFERTELLYHKSQNPSVYSTKEGGLVLYAGYGADGVYETDDINTPFAPVENNFVFSGPTTALKCSSECPAFFEMNGYKYLIVGFTGYFRTLKKGSNDMVDAIKLGETVYDGLCVPMVAQFTNGRRIMAGWIRSNLGWGSALVQREIVQEEGGRLGMRWVKEILPKKIGQPVALSESGEISFDERRDYIFETEVETDESGVFALDIISTDGAEQLKIDVVKERAQLTPQSNNGEVVEDIETLYEQKLRNEDLDCYHANYSDEYAISGVVNLGRRFSLKILFRYAPRLHTTVCDIEMGEKRTMILSKPFFFPSKIRIVKGRAKECSITAVKP